MAGPHIHPNWTCKTKASDNSTQEGCTGVIQLPSLIRNTFWIFKWGWTQWQKILCNNYHLKSLEVNFRSGVSLEQNDQENNGTTPKLIYRSYLYFWTTKQCNLWPLITPHMKVAKGSYPLPFVIWNTFWIIFFYFHTYFIDNSAEIP